MKKYNTVACGGTFDLFHKGHREFLRFALKQGEKVLIGITSDSYVKNSKLVESYEKRKEMVEKFLETEIDVGLFKIVKIDDVYGPTLDKDLVIDAIVVTKDSQEGAQHINSMRKERGLIEIDVRVAPLITGEDGKTISSSRIRLGEIDREGNLYISPQWLLHTLKLPDSVRLELKRPIGTLVKQFDGNIQHLDPSLTVTVGDVVTKMCNDRSFHQIFSIVDFVVQREKQYTNIGELGFSGYEKVLSVINPAGFLTPQLFGAVQKVFREKNNKSRFVICVDGEEDLAVLPVLLVAPLGHVVLYGQPYEGIIQISVTEESKNKARDFVTRFIVNP